AAGLAQDGYIITPQLSRALQSAAGWLGREPGTFALYPPMEAGMVLRNPDLASVLHEIGHSGLHGFYRGEVAASFASAIDRRAAPDPRPRPRRTCARPRFPRHGLPLHRRRAWKRRLPDPERRLRLRIGDRRRRHGNAPPEPRRLLPPRRKARQQAGGEEAHH